MYTILYTCDIVQDSKPAMAEWATKELFPWLPSQPFVFHRSLRSAGIDAPELVAYFDFTSEASAQAFWSSADWKAAQAKFKVFTQGQREYRLTESPLSGAGIAGTQTGAVGYTILYTCDVIPAMKHEMGEWAQEFFPWLRKQSFVYHRSMRNAGIDSPELVAWFDFESAESAQALWSTEEWAQVVARFRRYTQNQREYRLEPSPLSGTGIYGSQDHDSR